MVGTTTPLAAQFQPTLQRASPHPPPNGTRKKSLDPGQPLPPSLVLRSWRPDAQAPNFSIPWSRWGIWLQAGSPAFARELRTFFHRIVKKVVRFAPRPHASPNRHQGAKPGTTRPYDIVRVWSSQTCFAPPVRDRRFYDSCHQARSGILRSVGQEHLPPEAIIRPSCGAYNSTTSPIDITATILRYETIIT